MDDLHQLFRSLSSRIVLRQIRIDQVFADVVLQNLGNETLQRSTASSGLLKDPCALFVPFDGPFDRLNLPSDAPKPVEQLRPVSFDMSHL